MIYVLDHTPWHFDDTWNDKKNIFQYITFPYFIKNFLFVGEDIKLHSTERNEVSVGYVEKLLEENPDISVFACNLDCFDNKNSLMLYDEHICKKYPNVFFIFFYNELDITFLNNHDTDSLNNVIYVLNSFSTQNLDRRYIDTQPKVFPYYLINSYLQGNYKNMYNLYYNTYNLRKIKKYNFLNGIHKPHRIFAYDLIKKHELLDEGFFSYLDYTKFVNKDEHVQGVAEFLDMSIDECKEYLSKFQIPYLLETYDSKLSFPLNQQPGVYPTPFLTPPIYSWQSYINISSETNYIEKVNIVSLSEKSFKAFAGFNIPLLYGQPNLVDYLRHLGFDMFDDLFDNTTTHHKAGMIEKLDKNLRTIKNMSLEDLHEFYVHNWGRIEGNFLVLTEQLKIEHFNKIKNYVKRVLNK